ncbi:MAG TPA: hypothetical protein VIT68_04555 [Candidatus Gracilibacteria bacterium]
MKRFLLLLLVPIFFTACTKVIPSGPKTSFTVKHCKWGQIDPNYNIVDPCNLTEYEVTEGQSFGPVSDFYTDKPFEFAFQTEDGVPVIGFVNDLVIAGENINKASNQNPKALGLSPVCFRTRTYDAGEDLCIRLKSDVAPVSAKNQAPNEDLGTPVQIEIPIERIEE